MGEIESISIGLKPDQASGYPPLFEVRREIGRAETADQVFKWISTRIKPQLQVFTLLRCDLREVSIESFHDPRLTDSSSPPKLNLPELKELEAYLASNPLAIVPSTQSMSLYPQPFGNLPSQLRCEIIAIAPLLQNQNLKAFFIIGGFQKETPLEFFSDKTLLYITGLAQIISLTLERLDALDVAKRYEAMLHLLDKDNIQQKSEYERLASEISSKLWASMEMDTLLKITLQELGRTLKASQGLIQLENIQAEK